MEQKQVILGVDPGFHVTGFSLLKREQGKVYLLDCGYLKMSAERSLIERTGQFHAFMLDKIMQVGVTEIALETSFLGKNPQTFLKLGYLRGVLYLLAHQHNLGLYEFAPREVKAAVTGSGGASKEQVAGMVIRLFPKITQIHALARNDVTDALAVGICGIWRHNSRLQQIKGL